MEFVNLVIPAECLNPVLDFLASLNTPNNNLTSQASSAIEVKTIKFCNDDIQSTTKFSLSHLDEQNLIEQLKSLGIKYSEVKKYCQQYPGNIAIALERAGKPGTKRPVAMFISTLKNPGEIKSIVKSDRLDIQPAHPTSDYLGDILMSPQHQAKLAQVQQLLTQYEALIKYKAAEWKQSKAFAHKEVESIISDVISCYINDPVRFATDQITFKITQERWEREAQRKAEKEKRQAELNEELDNIAPEKIQDAKKKFREALDKLIAKSNSFTKKEEVDF
jgi:hypothetical protein